MDEVQNRDLNFYKTFNDFFSRQLKNNVRSINFKKNVIVFPSDGTVFQFGNIINNKIIQAKNHQYSLESLLAGNIELSKKFYNGLFINIYLEPHNYHRVHMPCNGQLKEIIYVPGDLYLTSLDMINHVPNLYARNERVIFRFETEQGEMLLIMIGSSIIGSIESIILGMITPPREGIIKRWFFSANKRNSYIFFKGQEIAFFKLGSTVINLFNNNSIIFFDSLKIQNLVYYGQDMAKIKI